MRADRFVSRRLPNSGFSLIEALVSILLLSLGIIGLLGAQYAAIGQNIDSQIRAQAVLHANNILNLVRLDPAQAASLSVPDGGCPTSAGSATLQSWRFAVCEALPGARQTSPTDNTPRTQFDGVEQTFTVTLRWQLKADSPVQVYSQTIALNP